MVYRLSKMNIKVKVTFFILVWVFSALFAVFGSMLIATAVILPNTPYEIEVNRDIIDIRQDMGILTNLDYHNPDSPTEYYIDVNLFDIDGRIQARTFSGEIIPDFHEWFLMEYHTNGSIYYIPEPSILVFDMWNGTIYEVKTDKLDLGVDIQTKRLYVHYNKGRESVITKITWDTMSTNVNQTQLGNYHIVTNRDFGDWISNILNELSSNFLYNFIIVGQLLLTNVAIGGGAGIIFAFVLIILRITRLFGGKTWTFWLLKALNGKLGRIVSIVPFFDFNGYFYVEERFVNAIDLSSIGSTLKELYKQRWYDILFFPTSLAAILTIFFVQNFPGEDKILALTLSPLLTPIVLVVLLFYFPMIWSFNEGRFKRMQVSDQGDIVAVRPLGKILRDGIGIIIGFSGILSLGALAVEVTEGMKQIPASVGKVEVAGFTLDIFSIILLLLWTVGLFLLLLGSIIVGSSVLAVNYLHSSHLNNIENLRKKSAEEGIITNWGSVISQFTPVAKKSMYVIEGQKEADIET